MGDAMADIHLSCSQCASMTTVSEYADRSLLRCDKCGGALVDAGTEQPAHARRLTLKKTPSAPPPPPGSKRTRTEASDPDLLFDKERDIARIRERHRHARQKLSQNHVVAWITFLALGAVMGFLRYGPAVRPPEIRAYLQNYGVILLLAFHLIVILKAFSDSILQGVLSIFVPGYSLYYIFILSDDFLLRAVFAGLLVGIGHDSAMFLQRQGASVVRGVSAWIRSGG
jgi:hypothetical protein